MNGLPDTAPCLLPGCARRCRFPGRGMGRPPAYCSDAHRRLAQRRRRQLQDRMDHTRDALSRISGLRNPAARAERARLKGEFKLLAWHLLRFPPPEERAGTQAPSVMVDPQASVTAAAPPRSGHVGPELGDLVDSAAEVVRLRAAYRAALDRRNNLVRDAVDNGAPRHVVADAAGLTGARVSRLVSAPRSFGAA